MSSMFDKYEWLTEQHVADRLCAGNIGRASHYIEFAKRCSKTRSNPSCPDVESERQYWICVESSGTFQDRLACEFLLHVVNLKLLLANPATVLDS